MELTNIQKTGILAFALVLISIVSIILINRYTAWESCQNSQPTIKRLSMAADSLASSLIKVEKVLEDQTVELEIKESLLEEKNDEIGYLSFQSKKIINKQNKDSKEMLSLRKKLASARGQLYQFQQNFMTMRSAQGLIYRIQIGLQDKEILPPLAGGPDAFMIEEVAGVGKYLFGHFETLENAQEFRDLFRRLGVKGAWIVPYINAKRVEQNAVVAYLETHNIEKAILSSR